MIRCSFFQPMADISGWCFRKFACEWWCRNSTRFGRRTGHAWAKKGSLGASSPNGPTFSRVHQHSLPKFIHVVYPCLSKCQHPGDYLWHRNDIVWLFCWSSRDGFCNPCLSHPQKSTGVCSHFSRLTALGAGAFAVQADARFGCAETVWIPRCSTETAKERGQPCRPKLGNTRDDLCSEKGFPWWKSHDPFWWSHVICTNWPQTKRSLNMYKK